MAKKKKKKLRMPPLSLLDKTVYWILMGLTVVFFAFLVLFPSYICDVIAFSDERVIATRPAFRSMHHYFLLFLPCISAVEFFHDGYSFKIPIFGKYGIKYGPPTWQEIYPIFMKNRPRKRIGEEERKERRKKVISLLGVVAIFLAIYPLSLFPRNCVTLDGSVQVYSVFNGLVYEYPAEQITSVTFDTYSVKAGKHSSTDWYCVVHIVDANGKEYHFTQGGFRKDSLESMTELKAQYPPEIISFEGTEYLDRVAEDHNYTEEESEMLYALYGMTAP